MSKESFDEWLASRPQVIRDLASTYPPDKRYVLIHPHGLRQTGFLHSYSENGTITVNFPQEWNPWQLDGDRQVFGLDPTDLVLEESCDG